MTTLKIDPEFRDKIPPLTDAEFKLLKENILSAGEVVQLRFGDLIVPLPHPKIKDEKSIVP